MRPYQSDRVWPRRILKRGGVYTLAFWLAFHSFATTSNSLADDLRCSKIAEDRILGLPRGFYGKSEGLSSQSVSLGRSLFFSGELSGDGKIACSTCHRPDAGFADVTPRSTGSGGSRTTRSTPTLVDIAFNRIFAWDGSAATLQDQVAAALRNPLEMNYNPKASSLFLETLTGINAPDHSANFNLITASIADYLRTLTSGNSRFDRFYFAGDKDALSALEQSGFEVFKGKGRCIVCHTIQSDKTHSFGGDYAIFTDNRFHNLGVHKIVSADDIEAPLDDLGRFTVTGDRDQVFAFKTPSLRDVSKRGIYMHNGSLRSLEEVVEFYNKGGRSNAFLDPLIAPLGLTESEKTELVAFLKTLDGTCGGAVTN